MPFPPAPEPAKRARWLSLKNLKRLRWPALAATVFGGPYTYFKGEDVADSLTTLVPQWTSRGGGQTPPVAERGPVASRSDIGRFGAFGGPAGAPVQFNEIFRFDISPDWVAGHWSEVTLGMADVELTGHRVMLVTGSRPEDLAGALTYYFDRDQSVRRIRFEGVTGDPRPLVAGMATQYRFVRCGTDVPGTDVYQVHRDGKAKGDLRIRSAPTIRANSSLGRYSVSLAIDHPRS